MPLPVTLKAAALRALCPKGHSQRQHFESAFIDPHQCARPESEGCPNGHSLGLSDRGCASSEGLRRPRCDRVSARPMSGIATKGSAREIAEPRGGFCLEPPAPNRDSRTDNKHVHSLMQPIRVSIHRNSQAKNHAFDR
jgi:hypothetical protein